MEVKIIEQSYDILYFPPDPERLIETAGRTCYKSHDKMTDDSHIKFVKAIKARGHDAMLEFGGFPMVSIVTNRAISHEIVRHRLFSFAQESTRYVGYHGSFTVICPHYLQDIKHPKIYDDYHQPSLPDLKGQEVATTWFNSILSSLKGYSAILDLGYKPQDARGLLPNDIATTIVVAGNTREWLHFFRLRTTKYAHPQMREIAKKIHEEFTRRAPVLFALEE